MCSKFWAKKIPLTAIAASGMVHAILNFYAQVESKKTKNHQRVYDLPAVYAATSVALGGDCAGARDGAGERALIPAFFAAVFQRARGGTSERGDGTGTLRDAHVCGGDVVYGLAGTSG